MKQIGLIALACAAALGAGCNGHKTENTTQNTNTVGTAGTEVSRGDRNFVNDQLAGGMTEIQLAKIAQTRATDPEVKQFATMMINDHTVANDQLKQIAMSSYIPIESRSNDTGQNAVDKLSKLQGSDFDKQYIDMMVDDHERDVRDLRSRVDENRSTTDRLEGKNPANPATVTPEQSKERVTMSLNEWAANTLPTVENHLNRAKEIQDRLNHPNASAAPTTRSREGTATTGRNKRY